MNSTPNPQDLLDSLTPAQRATLLHLLQCDVCTERALGLLSDAALIAPATAEPIDSASRRNSLSALLLRAWALREWTSNPADHSRVDEALAHSTELFLLSRHSEEEAVTRSILGLFYLEADNPRMALPFLQPTPELRFQLPWLFALSVGALALCYGKIGRSGEASEVLSTTLPALSSDDMLRFVWLLGRGRAAAADRAAMCAEPFDLDDPEQNLSVVFDQFLLTQAVEEAILAALDLALVYSISGASQPREAPRLEAIRDLADRLKTLDSENLEPKLRSAIAEFAQVYGSIVAGADTFHEAARPVLRFVSPIHRFHLSRISEAPLNVDPPQPILQGRARDLLLRVEQTSPGPRRDTAAALLRTLLGAETEADFLKGLEHETQPAS